MANLSSRFFPPFLYFFPSLPPRFECLTQQSSFACVVSTASSGDCYAIYELSATSIAAFSWLFLKYHLEIDTTIELTNHGKEASSIGNQQFYDDISCSEIIQKAGL
jgi:hypothetical protein